MVTTTDTYVNPNRVFEALRKALGLTVKDAAELCGVGRQTVYNWRDEENPARMSQLAIRSCAQAFDVPVELFDQHPAEAVKWLATHKPAQFRCNV